MSPWALLPVSGDTGDWFKCQHPRKPPVLGDTCVYPGTRYEARKGAVCHEELSFLDWAVPVSVRCIRCKHPWPPHTGNGPEPV